MNDRELLELAAKAANIDAQWDCEERGMMILNAYGNDTAVWNPLKSDGDAFRLAIKMNLQRVSSNLAEHGSYCWHERGEDPYAATRRAIVRAVVETYLRMKSNAHAHA